MRPVTEILEHHLRNAENSLDYLAREVGEKTKELQDVSERFTNKVKFTEELRAAIAKLKV